MRNKRLFSVVYILVIAALFLSACGGAAPTPQAPAPAQPTAAPAQPTAAPAQPTAAPAQPTAAPAQPTAAPAPPTTAAKKYTVALIQGVKDDQQLSPRPTPVGGP